MMAISPLIGIKSGTRNNKRLSCHLCDIKYDD